MIGVLWHFQEEKDEVSNFGTFMPMHDDTDTNTACFYLTNLSLLKYMYISGESIHLFLATCYCALLGGYRSFFFKFLFYFIT